MKHLKFILIASLAYILAACSDVRFQEVGQGSIDATKTGVVELDDNNDGEISQDEMDDEDVVIVVDENNDIVIVEDSQNETSTDKDKGEDEGHTCENLDNDVPGSTDDHFSCGKNKILICHVPSGDHSKAHTLCVGASAINGHIDQGGEHREDYLGSCDQ